MSDFEIKGIVQEKDIPEIHTQIRYDYEPLFDKFDRISSGSSVHIQIPIKRKAHALRVAFKKKYGEDKVRITSRSNQKLGVKDVYIIRN